MTRWMNIGEAADAAGVSAKMIRHYEQIGLVPAASRTDAGYRQYTERDLSVLRFIRQARGLGFSMDRIADLMGLWADSGRTSREVKALAQRHLTDLEAKLAELQAMKQGLERLVAACHGDDDPHCAILDNLAVHSPATPTHPACQSGPARKAAKPARAARQATPATPASTSHVDLMAWTRGIHQRHGT